VKDVVGFLRIISTNEHLHAADVVRCEPVNLHDVLVGNGGVETGGV
jgi:hypothetical protein